MSNLPNPYVGPRAYEAHETLYGRDREIRQLVDLLVAERIVLLHSPSGAGKTSLLQAGLIPSMQADDFHVLPVIRVNMEVPDELTGKVENRYLLSTILSLEEEVPEKQRLSLSGLPRLSLDDYLNCRQRPENASPSELLVFDQFEEVLTVSPSDRENKLAFFEQLGLALRNRNRWAIFSMREDYVAALAPYLRPIPNRLSATFRLDLLGREAAMQAIQKPAKTAGVDFTAPAAHKLVDDLSQVQEQALDGYIETRSGLYVEPVQLQVVCYRLWDAKAVDDRSITVEDLGQVGSVDDSLAAYYDQSVAAAAKSTGVSQRAIREWFGSRLITPEGVRSQVLQRAEASDGLDNRAIFQLVDAHLLRSEKRAGSTWFELAHDRLIAPVRKSNAAWLAAHLRPFQVQAGLWEKQGRGEGLLLRGKELVQAEKDAAHRALTEVEKEFMQACAKMRAQEAREKRRSRLMTILAIGATIAMIAAVIGVIFAIKKANEAEKSAQTARDALLRNMILQSQKYPEVLGENYNLKGLLAAEAVQQRERTGQQTFEDFNALQSFLRIQKINVLTRMQYNQIIMAVAFSPDGKLVVTGGGDGFVHVWKTETGAEVGKYQHEDAVFCVDFSPDGKWVVAGDRYGKTRIWDIDTGAMLREISVDKGTIVEVFFSPDGKNVVATGAEERVEPVVWVWDAASGVQKAKFIPEGRKYLSPDLSRLIVWKDEGSVEMWDTYTGNRIKQIQYTGYISSIGLSSDNRLLVWARSEVDKRTVEVLNIETGEIKAAFTTPDDVQSVSFSPNNQRVAANGYDKTVRVWDIASGKLIAEMPHDSNVGPMAFCDGDKWLVTTSEDYTVRAWEVDSGNEIARLQHGDGVYIFDCIASPRKNVLRIVSGGADGMAWVWETAGNEEQAGYQNRSDITSLLFSQDNQYAIAANDQGEIEIWDIPKGTLIRTKPKGSVSLLTISQDGSRFATGSSANTETGGQEGIIQVWETATGNLIAEEHKAGLILAIALNQNGQLLVSSEKGSSVQVWEVSPGKLEPLVEIPLQNDVVSIAFSPNSKRVATSGDDNSLMIWDGVTGEQVTGRQYMYRILAASFSMDGESIISGDQSSYYEIWNIKSGKKMKETLIDIPVNSMVFSPDGRWLASGTNDGTLQVWEVDTDRELARVQFDDEIRSITFSSDSKRVIAVVKNMPVQVFSFVPDDLIRQVCSRLTRNMTQTEWNQYLGGIFPYEPTCPNLPDGGE